MMRYERAITDDLPSVNGKKSKLKNTHNRLFNNTSTTTSFESKPFRFRSPSNINDFNGVTDNGASFSFSDNGEHHLHQENSSPSHVGSVDGLLRWGNTKKARVSRSEIRALADDESSSSSAVNKAHRRVAALSEKMLPPPPLPQQGQSSHSRTANITGDHSLFLANNHRKLEEQSTKNGLQSRIGGGGRVQAVSKSSNNVGKRSPQSIEKLERKVQSTKDEKMKNGFVKQVDSVMMNHSGDRTREQSEQGGGNTTNTIGGEKKTSIEWPRIYISLSRKEKEEDFFAMKGTKLPHRPKKRAKNVDKSIQYCFPGMWLPELTKSRYEVREKKSAKKQKQRGLKGMGSMESDSDE